MNKNNLVEIKKGEIGTGLLIESDGYISPEVGNNKQLFESYRKLNEGMGDGEWHCPYPFVVDAVFQKFGIENANGRIYPEYILKREVEKYQQLIKDRMAIGECYRPEAMILTETGWKHLYEVSVGENILTLNTEYNTIEIKPIKNIIRYHKNGKMINIKGKNINDVVTPEHGYPIYNTKNKFDGFITAQEILENEFIHYYIPNTGEWNGKHDEYMIIPKIKEDEICDGLKEKYLTDLIIPMNAFAKFMGIYLSEVSQNETNKICISQNKDVVYEVLQKILKESDVDFSIEITEAGNKTFVINDLRLCKYVSEFGLFYDKFVPFELKQQSKEILKIFYHWFVKCNGVFSTSKQLIFDLNEIQLKIGYSGEFSEEKTNNENPKPLYFSNLSLYDGIYLNKTLLDVSEVDYDGDVMCVEVENHVWHVMDNGKCHWTKNCNHPSDSVIDLSRVAINIIELHWESNTLVGKLEVLISEGFRKNGIISCQGDQVAHLLLNNIKIGVSSRGLGSITQKMGKLYVGEDYEITCWDVVSTPSTPNAYITMKGHDDLQQYVESKESNKNKSQLFEELDKYTDWILNI